MVLYCSRFTMENDDFGVSGILYPVRKINMRKDNMDWINIPKHNLI